MPSSLHEAPLVLLRERPAFVVELLRDLLGIDVPAHREVRVGESDFTQLVPVERRADLVLTLMSDHAVMGVIVEVQRRRDDEKRFAWPLYAAALHARTRAQTCLLVITPSEGVARWARKPITGLQLGSPFVPLVLGPSRVPKITSVAEARRAPELAVLSVLAHAFDAGIEPIAHAAVAAVAPLDPALSAVYTDVIFSMLRRSTRRPLEAQMDMEKYEFKTDFARNLYRRFIEVRAEGRAEGEAEGEAKGKAEGRAEGKATALLAILEARGVTVPGEHRARVLGCTDSALLDRWLARAAVANPGTEWIDDG